jgi:hypothetical protein
MINSVGLYSVTLTGGGTNLKTTTTSADNEISDSLKNNNASNNQLGNTLTISTLSSQLAASAKRADERDKSLTRTELADKAKNILNTIIGNEYDAKKTINDNEIPNTSDPALLARAKQATSFVNDSSKGGHSVKNPFSGLSHEQLSNIIYDDSDTFTVNERQAAWRESYDQEEAWGEKVAAQAVAEYRNSGKLTNFFTSILDHFNKLPAIEQAQYPQEYASNLQSRINLDFNYRTNQADDNEKMPSSLIDMLLKQNQQKNNNFSKQQTDNDS